MTSYCLCRGRAWMCAPAGHDPAAVFVQGLQIGTDLASRWVTPSLDLAHERQAVLRHVLGLATEIRAVG
jgi:hypothetical protein